MTACFTIILLAVVLSGYSVGGFLETQFSFSTSNTRFCDFSSMLVFLYKLTFQYENIILKKENRKDIFLILNASYKYGGLLQRF